jgi:hypothetical protein
MQFQVTNIEFDFDDDSFPEVDSDYQEKLIDETIGQIWDADDGDDLVEEITCQTGWCVKSVDYRVVLDDYEVPECEGAFEIDYTTQD